MGIYKIVAMRCIVFTLTFDSSPIKGEGDSVGCFGLLAASPCGYCLEASMTAILHHPVDSRLRGNDSEGCDATRHTSLRT